MRTSDFDYHLPQELIAQTPVEPRDASRLLVMDRSTGMTEHRLFPDIGEHLRPGDLLVLNRSRVIPARLHGTRANSGGRVELLLLRQKSPGLWEALGRPGRRLRPGDRVVLDGPVPEARYSSNSSSNSFPGIEAAILESDEQGVKLVRFSPGDVPLDGWGETPLPPYIHERPSNPERYQTVYSSEPGSVAAPTAGLHFTDELLEKLRQAGIEQAFVTLHIGLDTFRPVQGEDPMEHHIHTEYYEVSQETAGQISLARREGRRIVAVGTTSVRTLEQLGLNWERAGIGRDDPAQGATGQADIFILPGHRFRLVDAMITNFHLPRSTLLMLVSAFAGRNPILAAYEEAIERGYRFYSFGDAMFLH